MINNVNNIRQIQVYIASHSEIYMYCFKTTKVTLAS